MVCAPFVMLHEWCYWPTNNLAFRCHECPEKCIQESSIPHAKGICKRVFAEPIGVLLEAKVFDAVDLAFPQVDREAARSQQRLNAEFKFLLYSRITGLYQLKQHMTQIVGRPALGMQRIELPHQSIVIG